MHRLTDSKQRRYQTSYKKFQKKNVILNDELYT